MSGEEPMGDVMSRAVMEQALAALAECVNELTEWVEAHYANTKEYSSEARRYNRDIEPVIRAREAHAALTAALAGGETGDWQTVPVEPNEEYTIRAGAVHRGPTLSRVGFNDPVPSRYAPEPGAPAPAPAAAETFDAQEARETAEHLALSRRLDAETDATMARTEAMLAPAAEAEIERVAQAIKACVDEFESPADLYIRGEAEHRWKEQNPGKDALYDADIDFEAESYRIIARAAIDALPSRKSVPIEFTFDAEGLRKAVLEEAARWHDARQEEALKRAEAVNVDHDAHGALVKASYLTIAKTHRVSAAAIRAMKGDEHGR